MSSQASNDVIKQAQSFRQHFKINLRSNYRPNPLQVPNKQYEFADLPIRTNPSKKIHKTAIFPKLIYLSADHSNNIKKSPTVKRYVPLEIYSPKSAKMRNLCRESIFLENIVSKNSFTIEKPINREDFLPRKKRFALHLHLHLPKAESRPVSQESL